jgi:hypothetical protein
MEVSGYNGQVIVDDNWVTIQRKGAMAFISQGMKGDKKIPISNIISVQFKNANAMVNGYIQFATASGEGARGISQATADENTVMFKKSQMPEFEKLRDHIEELIARRMNNTGGGSSAIDVADELAKLAKLKDQGILSEDEFAKAKAKLLA